ncbi:MAG: GTP cyclohydrolase I FolE [Lachnospiraceae bacterium]|nr:GTP cyclohydrolase I FolE [Lachnospiraceae bacterium]
MDQEKIKKAVNLLLEAIGEDKEREGLKDTPDRIARMYEEIFEGYEKDPTEVLSKVFSADNSEMVIEKDITFHSMCEHHMMPFYGKAHIAYVPGDKVVGISKLARCVEIYARRLQIQERMTGQIADAIMENLGAKGVMVVLEAEHMCMTMRGVKKPGSKTVTMATRGCFSENEELKRHFFDLVRID